MKTLYLECGMQTAQTPYGPVRIKTASGMGVNRRKAEYEDLAAIAEKNGVSLNEVRGAVKSKRE